MPVRFETVREFYFLIIRMPDDHDAGGIVLQLPRDLGQHRSKIFLYPGSAGRKRIENTQNGAVQHLNPVLSNLAGQQFSESIRKRRGQFLPLNGSKGLDGLPLFHFLRHGNQFIVNLIGGSAYRKCISHIDKHQQRTGNHHQDPEWHIST